MLTDEGIGYVRRLLERYQGLDDESLMTTMLIANNLVVEIPKLLAEIERLRGLLAEVYPQHYGMLCELWGPPDQWPTYGAAAAVLHEKMRNELGYGEAK